MKSIFTAFVSVFICLTTSAQSVEYGYDACGNRITRQIILQKSNKSISVAGRQDTFSEELIGITQVRIYPNPTHGLMKVTFQTPDELQCSIEIYDTKGKQIVHIPSAQPEKHPQPSPWLLPARALERVRPNRHEWSFLRLSVRSLPLARPLRARHDQPTELQPIQLLPQQSAEVY